MTDMNGAGEPDDAPEPSLEEQIQALQAEVQAGKDQALRALAEAENTRRRAEREVNDARAYAIQKFARDLLDAADSLARAVQHAPKAAEDPQVKSLILGVEMTEKALQTAFERNGLKRIEPAVGEKFDPHQHQAVMEHTSSEVPPGSVVQVLQTGYDLFGRIVRPAMVVVAARDSTGTQAAPETPSPGADSAGKDPES